MSVACFRNLCLSMRPACSRDTLLLLWEHECLWVYGHRMVNDVDWDRYKQTYFRAVKKKFSNEDQVYCMPVLYNSPMCFWL